MSPVQVTVFNGKSEGSTSIVLAHMQVRSGASLRICLGNSVTPGRCTTGQYADNVEL